jgi:predicted transglutaminase-like cysteine proteinase
MTFWNTKIAGANRSSRTTGRWLAVILSLSVAASFAVVDIDRLMSLAKERYGQRGTDIMTQWNRLITETKGLSDTELLNLTNKFVNQRLVYKEDQELWGQVDYWATPLETMGRGSGDCEDYAIAKYLTLLNLGVSNEKLRLVYVRAKQGSGAGATSVAHMVLGYFAQPDSEPLILDNMITSVRPASSRQDLLPVFSFNSDGMWAEGQSRGDPTARLSHWRGVLERMRADGFALTATAAR